LRTKVIVKLAAIPGVKSAGLERHAMEVFDSGLGLPIFGPDKLTPTT